MPSSTRRASIDLIRGAWDATVDERPRFFAFTFLYVLAYTLDLLVPWAIGYTLGVFAKMGFSDEAFHQGMLGILAYTGLRMGNVALHHYARYLQNAVAYSARMHTLTEVFSSMLSYPLRWHIRTHSGDNLSKLHRSAGAIDLVVGTYVWQMIEGLVKIFFAAVAIFTLDVLVAVSVLIMAVFTILLMIIFNKKLTAKIRLNNAFGNKINRICVDYLVNVVTVKTLGLEEPAQKYLRAQKQEGKVIARKIAKYMELKWGATGLGHGLVIGLALAIYFINHRGFAEPFDIAQVYVLLNYLDRIFQAIGSFTGYYSGIVEAATAYEDAAEIIDEAQVHVPPGSVAALPTTWSSLELKNLNFSYVTGERAGLRDVGLTLKRGEKIALVGPSGGGKSTFLKVLAGLLTPDAYTVSTDSQVAINIDVINKSCLLVPQEPEIFSESVKYNLAIGEEYSDRELSFFISLCKLDTVVARLPQGLDSDLAEKGLNLSVGEKQRVALARGLLRAVSKGLILLDEPTSSLDPKTEKEIFLGLLYHFSDKTVLSACHRLNLVPLFDKIVLFEQGSILEVGTFPELLEKRGHFARAWDDFQAKVSAEQREAEVGAPGTTGEQ